MAIYSLEEIGALLQQHRHTLEEDYNASAFLCLDLTHDRSKPNTVILICWSSLRRLWVC